MGRGKKAHIDEELDEAVVKIMQAFDYPTKRKASKKAGEILNAGLNGMKNGVEEELRVNLGDEDEGDEDDFFTDSGFDHSMLGFD